MVAILLGTWGKQSSTLTALLIKKLRDLVGGLPGDAAAPGTGGGAGTAASLGAENAPAAATVIAVEDRPALAEQLVEQVLAGVEFDEPNMVQPLTSILVEIERDGARQASASIGVAFDQVRPETLSYGSERGAEMVGMRRLADGTVVANPNARWAITDTTRAIVRADVVKAIKDGDSAAELADRLQTSAAFSKARAETIARTELVQAHNEGAYAAYQASGGAVVGTRWATAGDDDVDEDICRANEAAGVVPLGEAYPSGHLHPLGHPRCRCSSVPVLRTLGKLSSTKLDDLSKANPNHDERGRFAAAAGGGKSFKAERNAIRRFMKESLQDHAPVMHVIGPVQNAARIQAAAGMSVSGFSAVAENASLRHAILHHGDADTERHRGQLPIDRSDLSHVPEIMARGEVSAGEASKRSSASVLFRYEVGKSAYTLVADMRASTKHLAFKTMWKKSV